MPAFATSELKTGFQIGVLLTLPMMQIPFTMALEQMLAHFQ